MQRGTKILEQNARLEAQREQRYRQRLESICKHLTRLSSVIVKCQCGKEFLRMDLIIEDTLEDTIQRLKERGYPTTMKCPRCGRTIMRSRDPSAVCSLDGTRVRGEKLFLCMATGYSGIESECAPPGSRAAIHAKATANSSVSVYWDDTLIGKTTADSTGAFTFKFRVPSDAMLGMHTVRITDSAGKKGFRTFKVRP